jgi:hypothetical protein
MSVMKSAHKHHANAEYPFREVQGAAVVTAKLCIVVVN